MCKLLWSLSVFLLQAIYKKSPWGDKNQYNVVILNDVSFLYVEKKGVNNAYVTVFNRACFPTSVWFFSSPSVYRDSRTSAIKS